MNMSLPGSCKWLTAGKQVWPVAGDSTGKVDQGSLEGLSVSKEFEFDPIGIH